MLRYSLLHDMSNSWKSHNCHQNDKTMFINARQAILQSERFDVIRLPRVMNGNTTLHLHPYCRKSNSVSFQTLDLGVEMYFPSRRTHLADARSTSVYLFISSIRSRNSHLAYLSHLRFFVNIWASDFFDKQFKPLSIRGGKIEFRHSYCLRSGSKENAVSKKRFIYGGGLRCSESPLSGSWKDSNIGSPVIQRDVFGSAYLWDCASVHLFGASDWRKDGWDWPHSNAFRHHENEMGIHGRRCLLRDFPTSDKD